MATQSEARQSSSRPNRLRLIGLIMLVAGIVGLFYWQMQAFETSFHGTVADDSLAAQIVDEAWVPYTPTGNPEDEIVLVVGKDEQGNVIFEGTEDEWGALWPAGPPPHEADLRRTWMYPAGGLTLAGLLLVVIGWRRSRPARPETEGA